MSAFVIYYTEDPKHVDELMRGIVEELGFPALRADSFAHFLTLVRREQIVAAILDLSTVQASPKTNFDHQTEVGSFRTWADESEIPVLILSDDADLAETEPNVIWGIYSGEISTILACLVAPLRQRHQTGLDDSSQALMNRVNVRGRDLDLRTSAVVNAAPPETLNVLVIGDFQGESQKIIELLERKFANIIQVSRLEEVRRYLRSTRPQAILISEEFDRFECALDTIRMSEVTRHTSIAILGNGSTFAPTLSRSPTLLFQQNTPPAYIVEQLSFGARVALFQTPRLLVIAETGHRAPDLVRIDGGATSYSTPLEIKSCRGGVDLVVLGHSNFETADPPKIMESIRERFGPGIPVLLFDKDNPEDWLEWVDGILNPDEPAEEHSRTIDVFAAYSRARTQIAERDDLTGANHWCGFRHSLSRRLVVSAEINTGLSILGVEIERFAEILRKHNSMHDTILRYVSDHLWQYFPKNATFRGPEGRFFVLSEPISEANFRKIEKHLDSIRSTTLRDPSGHGLYLRLHAAHLKVPPGILSARVCIDSILRMFSRMNTHSSATFLSAELDPELVVAPLTREEES